MSEQKKRILAIVAAVLVVVIAIGTTIYFVKFRNNDDDSVETTTESTTATPKATYTVDLEYIQRMLDKQVFTDKFETYTAETYATPNKASKEAYWAGIQQGKTVNPLLLAATSSYLSELGFDTPDVKPSELYDEPENDSNIAELNAKGEQTLNAVKKVIFSDEVKVRTDNLGNSAKAYYNSTPSKDDGIVYATKIGITGNTACWIITIQKDVDIDDAYADIVEANKASKDGKTTEATTKAKVETKQVIQLCRCGNTVDKKPKKPQPTTTQPPKTTEKKTTQSYTKNKQQDPVSQGNADRGGGSKRSEEDKTATSRYQPEEPTMPSSVRKVTTTKVPTTTKPTTTKAPSTTKVPTTTKPTTTAPKAEPTHVESNTYVDKDTGKTTVVNDEVVVTGAITRPKR